MKSFTTDSSPTSTNSDGLNSRERISLARLAAAMPDQVNVPAVRALLKLAEQDGVDPMKIYEIAVQRRPEEWAPAPTYHDLHRP